MKTWGKSWYVDTQNFSLSRSQIYLNRSRECACVCVRVCGRVVSFREVYKNWRFGVKNHISTEFFEPPNFFSVIDYQREAPQVISVKSCRVQGRI